MIISNKLSLAFIHIPKCAGTSVRKAILQADENAVSYWGVNNHPTLGDIDYAHVPLKHVEELLGSQFIDFENSQKFAFIRDPFDRFPSSAAEYFKNVKRVQIGELSDKQRIDHLLEVMNILSSEEDPMDPTYIHFRRQADYLYLDNQMIVDRVMDVADANEFVSHILTSNGVQANEAPVVENMTKVRVRSDRMISSISTVKQWLGRKNYDAIRDNTKFFWNPIKQALLKPYTTDWFHESKELSGIVSEYYQSDIKFYQTILHPQSESSSIENGPFQAT